MDEVFHCPLPMPAAEQKETFQAILEDTLAEDCSYDVVETVHEEFCNLIAEHKERKEPEPLTVSKQAVKGVLASCGVSENRLEAFTEKYDEAFGKDMQLSPKNIINDKKIEVQTPDVTIQVSAQRRDLVQTRVIDGTKYIVIRADEGVQVNGVHVHIE